MALILKETISHKGWLIKENLLKMIHWQKQHEKFLIRFRQKTQEESKRCITSLSWSAILSPA